MGQLSEVMVAGRRKGMTKHSLTIHAASHLDHFPASDRPTVLALAQAQWIAYREGARAFTPLPPLVISWETELSYACDLLGPSTGQAEVLELSAFYGVRPGRRWASRFVRAEPVATNVLTMVVGPHDGHPWVLYTLYAGPAAPREPGDLSLRTMEEIEASRAFWAVHALAQP